MRVTWRFCIKYWLLKAAYRLSRADSFVCRALHMQRTLLEQGLSVNYNSYVCYQKDFFVATEGKLDL